MSKYVIITPVKNEEKYIERTIISVASQNVRPAEWIIVDDHSQDKTREVIEHFMSIYDWIRIIKPIEYVTNEISAKIAHLVNYGVSCIKTTGYEFIMKLDADVTFDGDFCGKILDEFLDDSNLGIASGIVEYNGKVEKIRDATLTRGAAKFYRRECWEQIRGVYLSRGWDTIDNYAAQYYGWDTRKFDFAFEHLKEESKRIGLFKKHYLTGVFNGRIPYHPAYFFAKLFRRAFDKPFFVGALIQLYGFIIAALISKERPFPQEIGVFVRKKQLQKLRKMGLRSYF